MCIITTIRIGKSNKVGIPPEGVWQFYLITIRMIKLLWYLGASVSTWFQKRSVCLKMQSTLHNWEFNLNIWRFLVRLDCLKWRLKLESRWYELADDYNLEWNMNGRTSRQAPATRRGDLSCIEEWLGLSYGRKHCSEMKGGRNLRLYSNILVRAWVSITRCIL